MSRPSSNPASASDSTDRYPWPTAAERIKGHGMVYCDGVRAFETDYDLTITPAELRGQTFESGQEAKVSPDITGQLLGHLFQAEKLAETCNTLVLADGRAFDFRVLQPDTNEIVGLTWFKDPPTSANTDSRGAR